MRLEPELWDALEEICRREKLTLGEVVKQVEQRGHPGGRTSAVRVYVLGYFREAVSEDGHRAAGHGTLAAAPPAAEEPSWSADQFSREIAAVS
jgi:predicted DNA-binding ribbon-helix-helix protein